MEELKRCCNRPIDFDTALSIFMVKNCGTKSGECTEPEEDGQSNSKEELRSGDDLFEAVKTPLRIGALLGLVPINGVRAPNGTAASFSWREWRTFVTLLITLLIGANVIFIGRRFISVLTDSKRQSTGELVGVASGAWFYAAGMAVYLFFLTRSKDLTQYFQLWSISSVRIRDTVEEDRSLKRDVGWITLLLLGSCFGENAMFHLYALSPAQLARISDVTLEEVLHDYYNFNSYMYDFFDYHPLLSFGLLAVNKLTLYAWNFGDLILIVLCRALYGKFHGLNTHLKLHLSPHNGLLLINRGGVSWSAVRKNFLEIVYLLEGANRILAPLIWLSYATDIFFVCNQLYIELAPGTPAKNLLSTIYVVWSFLHLIMRTLAVNMMAAKINEAAHNIRHILQHCHPYDYDQDVRRLEEYVGSRVIGLSGNGCFIITRSFILMIMSAIFTLEVVLLQNSSLPIA